MMSHATGGQHYRIKTASLPADQRKLARSRSCSEENSGALMTDVFGYCATLNATGNQHLTHTRQGLNHQSALLGHHPNHVYSNHNNNPNAHHYISGHYTNNNNNSNHIHLSNGYPRYHISTNNHKTPQQYQNQNHKQRQKYVASVAGSVPLPVAREMDTFVAELEQTNSCAVKSSHKNQLVHNGKAMSNYINSNHSSPINKSHTTRSTHQNATTTNHQKHNNDNHHHHNSSKQSQCSRRGRREPLTIEEYENKFRQSATDLVLIERIFAGSIACNQLRAAIWPYLFGLIIHRGRFDKVRGIDGRESYVFIEHEANYKRWKELGNLFEVYRAQWESIQPDQEQRFTTFRERKSHIERDVVRCDRLHPFYAEQPQNLTKLTHLLMTYMMYDFDIGYVQGMSDIAAPILCMYQGDLVKTFWVFVEVMKLFRRNFELTQKTIHFQLNCLYKLIKQTDPVFAQYLKENDSSNCFFAFRAIVCQFKRELMKEDEDDYSNVLFLWDTIWCVDRRRAIQEEMEKLVRTDVYECDDIKITTSIAVKNGTNGTTGPIGISNQLKNGDVDHQKNIHQGSTEASANLANSDTYTPKNFESFQASTDNNHANSPRYRLSETEIFVLALCLSMIRRERDIIMARKLDGTDIHLHFINPKLAYDLNGFIEHAINIYLHLKNEIDLTKLTAPKHNQNHHHYHHHLLHDQQSDTDSLAAASPISTDGYDLLSDFLIIGGTSGSCMQIIG